ncbi:MAG: flagellar assembly protein FliH [Treponema sp.]|nr:flagellar assembly protein FliH [Treponema sp.]
MAKAVFRPGELTVIEDRVMISTHISINGYQESAPAEDENSFEPAVEEYTGPTAEDLRREADAFREEWEIQKKSMIEAAESEANEIVQTAELSAAKVKEQYAEEAEMLKAAAHEEAEQIIAGARMQAKELEEEIRRTIDDERNAALEQSREEGRAEGYAEGKVEVDRLIERTHLVLERAQDKRGEILTETERQIIDLVLLITRKVVKVISESQRDVIIANVTEALRKVRDTGTVIIRVNLADLKLATEHTKEFIKMLEGVKTIQVQEDSSIDSGGCIIETDFGEIDARIASQLAELEAKILEISPIKTKVKSRASKL